MRSSPQLAASTPSLATPAWYSTPCSTPPPHQRPLTQLSQVSQVSQVSQLLGQLLIPRTIGMLKYKQQMSQISQVSQVSQLPRKPLIPQTTRTLTHQQHLSQMSQLSQMPPQRRPPLTKQPGHGKALPTINIRRGGSGVERGGDPWVAPRPFPPTTSGAASQKTYPCKDPCWPPSEHASYITRTLTICNNCRAYFLLTLCNLPAT